MKQNLNIIYLSYDGLTDPLGESQVLQYVIGLNNSKQFKFTIISFEKKHSSTSIFSGIKNILLEKEIEWIPLKYTKFPPIFSTIYDIIRMSRVVKNIIKQKKIDLIHSRSYIPSLVALTKKKQYGIPFIFDMRGFYADERVDGKIWTLSNFFFKKVYDFFKKKEKEFLQYSDFTVSLTESGKNEIISWALPKQSPIAVIPCCAEEELFNKEKIQEINKLKLNNKDFVLSYIGSIGTWYMLDEMLRFFKVLKAKQTNAKFLFITKNNPEIIYENSKTLKIDLNDIIVVSSDRKMMPSYIGISNFSIFFILPVFSKKGSSPTKMGEIMNLGIPIICNSGVGDVDIIMQECMSELLIKEFTTTEYARVANLISLNYKIDRIKIMETSNLYFSLSNGVKKYLKIYDEILN